MPDVSREMRLLRRSFGVFILLPSVLHPVFALRMWSHIDGGQSQLDCTSGETPANR